MGSSVSVAYRFRPEGRAWASPFFRELAGLLVEFDPGSSVLLEYGLDDPRPWIIPSRDGIGPAISAAAAAVPGSLERRSPVPAWPIVRTETLTWAILGPDSRSGVRSPSRPTPAPFLLSDLPGLPPFPDTVGGPAAPPGVYAPIVRVLWSARADGLLDVRWETLLGYGPEDPGVGLWLAVLKRELRRAGFPPCAVIRQRSFANVPRPWQNGSFHWAGSRFAFVVSPATAAAGVLATLPAGSVEAIPLDRHVISIGATGSGKTELLVRLAAAAMADGFRVVALDVHGDLAPRIVAALDPGRRERLLAIDPTVPGGTVGIDLLHYSEPSDRERLAGQIVAILRRLSSENGDLYWGFRLERIFDVFVRLALEEQGTLLDIYGLLTDERRREASRLHTQDPAIGRLPRCTTASPSPMCAKVASATRRGAALSSWLPALS